MTRSIFLESYERLLACLIEARTSAGIKQVELASILGRPQSFVSKVENAERRIDVVEFILICRALKVDPSAILSEVLATMEKFDCNL